MVPTEQKITFCHHCLFKEFKHKLIGNETILIINFLKMDRFITTAKPASEYEKRMR